MNSCLAGSNNQLESGCSQKLEPQSNLFNVHINTGTTDTKQENIHFVDQNPAWEYTVGSEPDPSYGSADMDDASLGEFFKRPLKIADIDWATTDANFFNSFNPWELYFENARVINRINNFNNLRSKLHLKFVINGNGFHYGRVIASYKPLASIDELTVERAFFNEDVIGASQRPHIYLDPTTSMGGDMVLPFFWYNNALSVPKAEWSKMGRMDIKAIQRLKHANGATDAVRISVFAWTEDLVLSTPTNKNSTALIPQGNVPSVQVHVKTKSRFSCCNRDSVDPTAHDDSSELLEPQSLGKDEYGGKVSGPASALANAAGMLSVIPGIGLYARASQLALSGVANIAALFGYCRPVVDAPIVPYRPAYFGSLANTNVPDSCTKLTTDLKQETTIDPRTVGLSGVDEMNIKSICTRESYLTNFDWDVATTTGTKLFTVQVTPYLWDTLNAGGAEEIHMTPSCHVGCLFQNWRGTMKYRFQVVCSNFHKGRIQIQYDPFDSEDNEFNVAYNKIIDISEEKDFTVEVGWGIPACYGESINPGTRALPFRKGTASLPHPNNNPNEQNGQISVWVLNDLTVPASDINNNIQINVFTSCGENMEFANPTDEFISSLVWVDPFEPQSGVLEPQSDNLNAPDQEETGEPSKPMAADPLPIMAAAISETDGLNSICFGEKIVSIRSLLKRYTVYSFYAMVFESGNEFKSFRRRTCNFPYYRGRVADGIHVSNGNPYNYVKSSVLNYMTPCYEGWRGGLRKKTVCSTINTQFNTNMQITRNSKPGLDFEESRVETFLTGNSSTIAYSNIPKFETGFSGTTMTPVNQNPVLEVELPYHYPQRFIPAKIIKLNSGLGLDTICSNTLNTYATRTNLNGPYFVDAIAAGDDFSLFFYTGVPIMYYAPSDPSP